MGRPQGSKGVKPRRAAVKVGQRNSAARRAEARRRSISTLPAHAIAPSPASDGRDAPGKRYIAAVIQAKALQLWRDEQALILFVLLPLALGSVWLYANSVFAPLTRAELISRTPVTAVHARGGGIAGAAAPSAPLVTAGGTEDPASDAGRDEIALLAPVAPDDEAEAVSPDDLVAALEHDPTDIIGRERACSVEEAAGLDPTPAELSGGGSNSQSAIGDPAFGLRLAEAAEAQTGDIVVYTDSYRRISYPMGDVSALYGVCTDVVIRAYRALGIDLQAAVKSAGVGSGDPNIDHRRTEILRRFFARSGTGLPVTDIAEDYLPGDVVTYYRPQNHGSQSHIAVVSTKFSRAGRPMIVHNRGWGPQIEDALFVDRITGHYRYRGGEAKIASAHPQLPALKVISKKARRLAKRQAAREKAKAAARAVSQKTASEPIAQR